MSRFLSGIVALLTLQLGVPVYLTPQPPSLAVRSSLGKGEGLVCERPTPNVQRLTPDTRYPTPAPHSVRAVNDPSGRRSANRPADGEVILDSPPSLVRDERQGKGAGGLGQTLRFEVSVAPGLLTQKATGRLMVVLSQRGGEPRQAIGATGDDAPPVLGRDVQRFGPGMTAILDSRSALFPLAHLSQLKPGDYIVQAVFSHNPDLRSHDAPGNLYSLPQRLSLTPDLATPVRLTLTQQVPPETLPPNTEYLRFVKIRSALLSKFYGRPIYLRAGIILPKGFAQEAQRRYPLWVRIGGFHTRYTAVQRMMAPGSRFREAWLAEKAPRMVLLHLDGDGPLGDPYQVNSANHGPYGDAVTQELIPAVEKQFRCLGEGRYRVVDGGSTGGWVSLALQVFYPDFFNGVWSSSPDPVDFRAYQLVNIYTDKNAYRDAQGQELPSARTVEGRTLFTIRHECQMENVIGANDSYTFSGGQWGAWNATFSPRGSGGQPVPLWDPKTGAINHAVAEQWKPYDLRLYLEKNWQTLAPKLRGKIRIWVGESDNYYLERAVHLLHDSLQHANPPFEGTIKFGPGKGHTWIDLTESQLMAQMAAAMGTP